jgi:hypothetical protein
MLHGLLHLIEWNVGDCRVADHENQIDTALNMIEAQPHGLAHPAPGAVALHGIAQMFPGNDPAARLAAAVGRRVQA